MFARLAAATCAMVFGVAALGCVAAGADEEGATDALASAFSPRDDVPSPVVPFDRPMPALDRPFLQQRPFWDLQRYLEPGPRRSFDVRGCYQYEVEIYDPSQGRDIEIPITVCN